MAETQNESNDHVQQGWHVSSRFLKFWDGLIIFFIGTVILLVILRIVVGSLNKNSSSPMSYMIYEEPAEEVYLSETEVDSQPIPTISNQPTPEPAYGEVTDKTINLANKRLGEVEV